MNRSLTAIQGKMDAVANSARTASLILAGGAFITGAKHALDYASSLGEASQQLGLTTRDFQIYSYAATQAGLTQEELEAGLGKMTVSLGKAALGAKAQGAAFEALGISVRNANGSVKTAGQVIPEIADALAKVKDPAQRAAAEVALFGKSGQKLDTILSEGSGAIKDYAKQAEDAGMIIADPLIKSADEAADKMAALTAAMKVNFANEVAANADAILGLANALQKVTLGALHFISTYPRLTAALAGAAIGARLGGPIGAGIGAGVGVIGGQRLAESNADANMDIGFRSRALQNAVEQMQRRQGKNQGGIFDLRTGDTRGGGSLKNSIAEVKRQTTLLRQATAAARGGAMPILPPGEDLPEFLASGGGGGGKGKSSKGPADRSAENLLAFQNDLAKLDQDLLRAKQDNLSDVGQIADMERQQLTIERGQYEKAIAADVTSGKLNGVQAQQLLEKDQQIRAEQMLTISTEELASRTDELLTVQAAANDNQRDLLQAQEGLATTAAERGTFALKLLELDRQEEELKLKNIIEMARIGKATAAEAQAAEDRLRQLPEIYSTRAEGAKKSNKGPMGSYLDDINMSAAEMDEALENVAVDGLKSLEDGLMSVIDGTKSVGAAFRDMAQGIIQDLIRIAIRKMIVNTIATAVFGGMAEGGLVEGYATGGFVSGPGSPTSDSIMARLSNGEFVMSAAAVRRIGANNLDRMNKGDAPGFGLGGLVGKIAIGALFGVVGLGIAMALDGGGKKKAAPATPAPTPMPNNAFGGVARNDNRAGDTYNVTINAGNMSEREARPISAQIERGIRQAQARNARMGA